MALPSTLLMPHPQETQSDNPFHEKLFQDCWFQHLAEKNKVIERHGEFVLHEKRVAKGLLTVRELKFCASNTGWFQDLTEERVEAFKTLSQEIAWDYLYTVWADSRKKYQALGQLQQLGYPMASGWAKPMHVVDLRDGYDGYLAQRNSKDRYNIRQKLKNAAKVGSKLFTYDRFEDIEPFFQQFFELHIPYWEAKTGHSFFSDPAEQAFTVAWAKGLYHTGQLRLHGLMLGGKLANLSFSIMQGNTMHWALTINTGHMLETYPGMVSLYLRLQEAATEGATVFNMAYGALPYKLQIQTHTDARNVLIVFNPKSIKGQLFRAYYHFQDKKDED